MADESGSSRNRRYIVWDTEKASLNKLQNLTISFPITPDGHNLLYKLGFVRFKVLTASSMKTTVSWDVAPSSLIEIDRRFGGAYFLHQKTARRNIPEDSHIQVRFCRCSLHVEVGGICLGANMTCWVERELIGSHKTRDETLERCK
jgi:hypothetical protein